MVEQLHIERRERFPVSVSAAVFIENERGEILLLQQAAESKGYKWGPPAGGMEAHENPVGNILREALEEIKVKVQLIDLVGIYTIDRGDGATGIGFVFRGSVVEGDITPKVDEIMNWGYFSVSQIRQMLLENKIYKPEYNAQSLKDWVDGKSYSIDIISPLTI